MRRISVQRVEDGREPADNVGMAGPSFRFRLERVRALRERHEDAAKQAFAGAMMDCARSERDMQEAAQRMASARESQLDATSAPTSALASRPPA